MFELFRDSGGNRVAQGLTTVDFPQSDTHFISPQRNDGLIVDCNMTSVTFRLSFALAAVPPTQITQDGFCTS